MLIGYLSFQFSYRDGMWRYLDGKVFGFLYLGSWLFLLIVGPLFLRSLRWIALMGWIIAFGIILYFPIGMGVGRMH